MADKLLCVENLNKSFKTGKTKTDALTNCSFYVEKGSVCGLLGMNGAGKTTAIKCISNLLIPESGNVFYNSIDITKKPKTAAENISVLLDGGRNLFWFLSVEENIKYFSLIKNAKPVDQKKKNKIYEYLELNPILKRPIHQLSFGMKQRANIAAALMNSSELFIFDEPTTGLDIKFQNDLKNLIKILNTEFGVTVLLSSHDMEFVKETCSDCVLIHEGRTLRQEKTENFLTLFNTVIYEIIFRKTIDDSQKEQLKNSFSIVEMNDEVCKIAWNNSNDLNELFLKLDGFGIKIKTLSSENTLRSSVINLIGGVINSSA